MSPTDQVQDIFDRAIASVSPRAPRPIETLHARLRQRRIRARMYSAGALVLAVLVSVSALVVGLTPNTAFAVTLYPYNSGPMTNTRLATDQRVMTARLHDVGFPNASVNVTHGTLVVINGPKELTNPTSWLTSSPVLLIRSVACYAGVQSGSPSRAQLPSACSQSQYDSHPVSGFRWPTLKTDPTLAAFATTTPAQDAKSPNAPALLPVLNEAAGGAPRYLVGPTLLTLSSRVASAKIVHMPLSGGWIVDITLNSEEARQWDHVANKYFHRQLAVDLNGVIVEAPFIQPASSSFSSFKGQMDLLAVSKTNASDLAAALTSGPLAEPLSVSPWRAAAEVKGPIGFNNVGDQVAVNAVACNSGRSCSAVGFVSNSHVTQPFVAGERNGVWASATIPPGLTTLSGERGGQLDAISCTAELDCTAIGWYTTSSQRTRLFIVEESNGKWSPARTIDGPAIPKGDVNVLPFIACPSAIDCVATGSYSQTISARSANPPRPFIIDELNGHWGSAAAMRFPPSTKPFVNVTTVACRSVGNCSIGGDFESSQTALIDTETNGVWGSASPVPGITSFGRFSSSVSSISCGSANSCSAGGTFANRTGDRIGFVTDEVDGTWRETEAVTGAPDLHLFSNSEVTVLSCRATDDCTALGDSVFQGNGGKEFVLRESNGVWGRAMNLRGPVDESYEGLDGATLSCGSPTNCVVSGKYGFSEKFSSGSAPFVADESDGTWTRAIEIPGWAKLDPGNYNYVQAVSCGDPNNCALVGGYNSDSVSAFFASTRSPVKS